MTVLPSIYSNTTETALMAELQKLKSKAQTSERRRQIRREHREASKMQETKKPDPEPHQTEKSKPKCMKQEVQAAQLLQVAYAAKIDLAVGDLIAIVVKGTPALSAFLSWEIQDLGPLIPEWGN
ncbi:hypothetical protein PF010_g20586 [Phytophthora fragariae]|uniref:Uncharacterized protein n=1 Tax=Phytophthora fragariae TaxID=53985 RepID=A0A6G0KEA5_9STRA|nr:hypothetical protein PF003_g27655 [Phytophthora fragariae]KAE9085083.1 hypothetical protein PF010_g20586 [Phytophthora fragariae]